MPIPAAFFGGRLSSRSRQRRRDRAYRPGGLDLPEGRSLLSHGLVSLPVDRGALLPAPTTYDPLPIPISDPGAIVSTDPIWDGALAYQYGPSAEQEFWVFLPTNPNGKLDLIVHSGGFRHGDPTSPEIDGFTRLDLSQGTTLVSIGYRLLDMYSWPAPVDDIAQGIDDGYEVAQALTGDRIVDVTETGLSAGGTALALINYSAEYPSTTVQPDRITTISSPLEANASSRAKPADGFRYTEALRWDGNVPKSNVPITLMGTPGDPIAMENGRISTIGEFSTYLRRYGIKVDTYFDPHGHGRHGSISGDFPTDPDVESALLRAYSYDG